MMKTNGLTGYGRIGSIRMQDDPKARATAMTESELVDSIVGFYKEQYRKLNGICPYIDKHNDVERTKAVLRNRPGGTNIMQEVAGIMDFVKTMRPSESLGKLLTRYLSKNILRSGATVSAQLSTKEKQDLRVQDPREETAGVKATVVAEGAGAPGDHKNTGKELAGEGMTESLKDDPAAPMIDRVAMLERQRPYLEEQIRIHRASGFPAPPPAVTKRGEVNVYFAKKLGISPTLYTYYKLVLKHGDEEVIALVREEKLKARAACALARKLNKGQPHGLAQEEKEEAAAGPGASRRDDEHKNADPVERTEEAGRNEDLSRKVMELEEKIRRLDPRENAPDPEKYISAREFFRIIEEKRKLG